MAIGATTRFGLTTWSSGDDAFGRAQFQQANLSIDNLAAIFRSGATGDTPDATEASHQKTFWYDTTTSVLYYNDGSAWRALDDKAISGDAYTVVAGSVSTPQGSSVRLARSDHKHAVSTAAASSISGSNSEGSSASLARADHNHNIASATVTASMLAGNIGKALLSTDIVKATNGGILFNTTDGLSINLGATLDISSNAVIVKTNTIGPTHLTTAVAGDGLTGGNGTALAVSADGTTVEVVSDAVRVRDTGIGKAKLNSDVVKANGGLVFTNVDGLSADVDGTTVELAMTGDIRVKDSGIGKAKLNSDVVKTAGGLTFLSADGLSVNTSTTVGLSSGNLIVNTNSIGPTHLTTAVAGNGLAGGNGTALSVNVDGTTLEINADTLRVRDTGVGKAKLNSDVVKTNGGLVFLSADGLSVNTDNTTTELSVGGTVRVKDAGVGKAKLNTDVVKSLGGLTFTNADGLSVNTSATVGLSSGNLIVNTNSVGPTHLTTGVAGNGITGGNGTALAALADPNGVATGVASISVGAGGIRVNGGIVFASAGAPSASYPDGNMSVDTTNHLLYYRSGSTWRNALWAAGTANSAPSAKGVWVSNGTAPTTQGSVGDIWITY